MKLKILLRFGVTIAILAVLILGAWFIWFKPSDEMEVFNNLTNLIDNDQKTFSKNLDSLESTNMGKINFKIKRNETIETSSVSFEYLVTYRPTTVEEGSSQANKFNSVKKAMKDIVVMRMFLFGKYNSSSENLFKVQEEKDLQSLYPGLTKEESVKLLAVSSFTDSYKMVDSAFGFYYAYSQLAENVSKDELKDISSKLDTLKNSYAEFNAIYKNFETVKTAVESVEGTSIASIAINSANKMIEIKNIYEQLYNKMYEILRNYTNLTANVKNFVVNNVFDGSEFYDYQSVAFNVVLNSIQKLTETTPQINFNPAENCQDNSYLSNYCFAISNDYMDRCANVGYVGFNFNINVERGSLGTTNINYKLNAEQIATLVSNYELVINNYPEALTGDISIYNLTQAQKNGLVNYDFNAQDQDPTIAALATNYSQAYFDEIKNIINCFFIKKG